MKRYVAFLRAINTPPRWVKMNQLVEAFSGLGLKNVSTFIASGNVVFDTNHEDRLASRIEGALLAKLGFEVPTFLRTAAEVIAVAEECPFSTEDSVEVSFLYDVPQADKALALEASAVPPDRLAVVGRRVYWSHEGPRRDSRHSEARVVKTLGVITTQRSMRTIHRLIETHLQVPSP